jgi:hypothetical protein
MITETGMMMTGVLDGEMTLYVGSLLLGTPQMLVPIPCLRQLTEAVDRPVRIDDPARLRSESMTPQDEDRQSIIRPKKFGVSLIDQMVAAHEIDRQKDNRVDPQKRPLL